jgi:O-antigen ligase
MSDSVRPSKTDMANLRPTSQDIAFVLLVVVLVAAPFPMGSIDTIWIAIWISILSVVLMVARPASRVLPLLMTTAPFLIGCFAYAVVVVLQSLGYSLDGAYPLAAEAERLLGTGAGVAYPIPDAGIWYAAPAVASFLAFAAGLVFGGDSKRASMALKTIAYGSCIWIGVGAALFIMAQANVSPIDDPFDTRFAGNFVNANTAATFSGSATIIFATLALDTLRRLLPSGNDFKSSQLVYLLLRPTPSMVRHTVLAAACFLATIATGSRAGLVFTGFGLVATTIAMFRQHFSTGINTAIAATILAISGAIAILMFGAEATQRFDGPASAHPRQDIYAMVWRMVLDRPWTGHGLGAFEWAFPPYRTDSISILGVLTRAHSVPLQIAVDVGLFVAAAMVVASLAMLVRLALGATERRNQRTVPCAALGVATLGFLHALVDFSIQIPGFAIVFWVIVGLGLGNVVERATREPRSKRSRMRSEAP